MAKILCALCLLAGVAFSSYSQIDLTRKISENTDIFHGKWVAQNGNISYEMTLKREMLKIPEGENMVSGYRETIWGKIRYIEKGKVIRETPDNGFEAAIGYISLIDPKSINFGFYDRDNQIDRNINFILDEKESMKATIILKEIKNHQKRPGWNQTDPFPDGMTWTKVE